MEFWAFRHDPGPDFLDSLREGPRYRVQRLDQAQYIIYDSERYVRWRGLFLDK